VFHFIKWRITISAMVIISFFKSSLIMSGGFKFHNFFYHKYLEKDKNFIILKMNDNSTISLEWCLILYKFLSYIEDISILINKRISYINLIDQYFVI